MSDNYLINLRYDFNVNGYKYAYRNIINVVPLLMDWDKEMLI